ncbi:hypothetical protein [Leptolyngbya sp. NIES-2104]|uniref:hypothetical protein n=1 Tax=Leptolyngbya sp. NIES-2104 TaxID=1552121 RepID=UPI0006EC8FDD|nr:hypothetical protein [Leptolyngbya sp. NIES-2104]GAP99138.1 hypothetical protein NIES2104_56960 [Leptolyngbya sp. NIES-2104]
MSSHTLKPLCYYQSDRRDEILSTIALEFGDHFEKLTIIQKREALAVMGLTTFAESLSEAQVMFHCSVMFSCVPRNFYLLAEQLTPDGRLALSIALAQSLRTYS